MAQFHRYRFELIAPIGSGLFTSTKGAGDTWEEALEKAGIPRSSSALT